MLHPKHNPGNFVKRLPVAITLSYTTTKEVGDHEGQHAEDEAYAARLTGMGFGNVYHNTCLMGIGRSIGRHSEPNSLRQSYDTTIVQEMSVVAHRQHFNATVGQLAGRAGRRLNDMLQEMTMLHGYVGIMYEIGDEQHERELCRPEPTDHDLAKQAKYKKTRHTWTF